MIKQTCLYLLGGSSAYSVYADDFVSASGGNRAKIVALLQTREGWEKHNTEIVNPWKQRGVTQYEPVVPDEEGALDKDKAIFALNNATGIFIGGGHTPTYHQLFATKPIRSVIRAQYQKGVPVAGMSAGALISMEKCQLTPDETSKERMEIVKGLNLAKGFVIGVHFTEWVTLPEVLDTMKATQTRVGIGIDEPACIVCINGAIVEVLGTSAYKIEMINFESTLYKKMVLERNATEVFH